MNTTSIEFAGLARILSQTARLCKLVVPTFASPPGRTDLDRSIRRRAGAPLVAVRLAGRPPHAVAADMIEGVVVANDLAGPSADSVRSALWLSIEEDAQTTSATTVRREVILSTSVSGCATKEDDSPTSTHELGSTQCPLAA